MSEDSLPAWVELLIAVASVLTVIIAWIVFLKWKRRKDGEAIAWAMNRLGRRGRTPTPQERRSETPHQTQATNLPESTDAGRH